MQFAGSENFTSARQLKLYLYKRHSLSSVLCLLKTCYVQIMGVRAINHFRVLTGLQKFCMRISVFSLSIYDDEALSGLFVLFLLFLFVCVSTEFVYCNWLLRVVLTARKYRN